MKKAFVVACFALLSVTVQAQDQVAILMNGVDGYAEVPASPSLVPAAITVEAWVVYDESTLPVGGFRWPTLVRSNITPGAESYFLRVDAGQTNIRRLRWMVSTTNSGRVSVSWDFPAGGLLGWTQVAATFDGTTSSLYVNGGLVGSAPASGTIVNSGGNFRIGKGDDTGGPVEVWNGAIDELRLWSYARSPAEIAAGMFQVINAAPFLEGSWHMDGDALDASGTGNHGTVVGTVAFGPPSRPLAPEWQVNGAQASLDVDGVLVPNLLGSEGALTRVIVGTPATVNVGSTLVGNGHDMLIGLAPTVPASGGGFTTPNGQVINMNLADPTAFFLFGSGGLVLGLPPFTGNYSIPVTPLAPLGVSAQVLVLDPGNLDGASLSQASRLEANVSSCGPAGTTWAGPGDDTIIVVPITGSPIPFYGTSYSSVNICSNGFLSFGAQVATPANYQVSEAQFLSGPPVVAPLWWDWRPNGGGTVTYEEAGNMFRVVWTAVPAWPTTTNPTGTFCVSIDQTSGQISFGYDAIDTLSDPGFLLNPGTGPIVGISPGGAAPMGGINMSAASGYLTPNANDPIYEKFSTAGAYDLIWTQVTIVDFGSGLHGVL
jgi:hypothetical protein